MTFGIVLACLIGLAALAWMIFPVALQAIGKGEPPSSTRPELEDLYIQRAGTYATLKELEFDHETGKLIEEDYRELRARYAAEAAQILRRIDDLEGAARS